MGEVHYCGCSISPLRRARDSRCSVCPQQVDDSNSKHDRRRPRRQAPQYTGSVGTGRSPASSAGGSPATVAELPELRVEVDSIQVMKNGAVLVSLKLVNRSQADLAIVLDCCTSGLDRMSDVRPDYFHSFVTDDEGNQYRLDEITGIGGFRKGSPLLLSPGIPKSVALRFTTSDSERRGKIFSLISDFAVITIDKEGRPQRDRNDYYLPIKILNVSIRDLRPGK